LEGVDVGQPLHPIYFRLTHVRSPVHRELGRVDNAESAVMLTVGDAARGVPNLSFITGKR